MPASDAGNHKKYKPLETWWSRMSTCGLLEAKMAMNVTMAAIRTGRLNCLSFKECPAARKNRPAGMFPK